MEHLLSIGVSNAVAAVVLALVAAAVCRVYQRPALAHALWLLVLLKLVTPPIWTVPVGWLTPAEAPVKKVAAASPTPSSPVLTLPEDELHSLQRLGNPERVEVGPVDDEPTAAQAEPMPFPARVTVPPPPAPAVTPAAPHSFAYGRLALAVAWLTGAALFLTVALVRVGRFRRVLTYATRAPADVEARARRIARRLGLADTPGVWFVPGAVCPMLWAAGGPPRLLIPAGLWDRLDGDDQRDTLLAHELAHLRRRDHWVRPLELLATALYWWHPAVWWARHELREAEEQCCDAWVLWSLPGSLRHYMNALLEAVEFVSEGFDDHARPTAPALASGLGQFQHLKRRLIMMKQRNVTHTRSLTWAGFAAVCGAAALLLPLAPTLAQQQSEDVKQEQKDRSSASSSSSASASSSESASSDVNVDVNVDETASLSPDVRAEVNVEVNGEVPVLSQIPIVGDLFRKDADGNGRGLVVVGGEKSMRLGADRVVLGEGGKRITLDGNVLTLSADKRNAEDDDRDDEADVKGKAKADAKARQADAKAREAEVKKARADVDRLSKELERAAKRLAELEGKRAMAAAQAQFQSHGITFRLANRDDWANHIANNSKDVAKIKKMSEALHDDANAKGNYVDGPKGAGGGDDIEARLNMMEKHLAQMMDEMKQLRAEGKERAREAKQKDKGEKDNPAVGR